MTIDEMIARLKEYRDSLGGDAEIRLVTQPNWPFETTVQGLVSGEEINSVDADDDGDTEDDNIVYIVEGTQLGYASKRTCTAAY